MVGKLQDELKSNNAQMFVRMLSFALWIRGNVLYKPAYSKLADGAYRKSHKHAVALPRWLGKTSRME